MNRENLLKKYPFNVCNACKKRVIVHTDINTEADDHFAVAHHLLTPTFDVLGIIASHYERKMKLVKLSAEKNNLPLEAIYNNPETSWYLCKPNTSATHSYEVCKKLLAKMDIDDVPVLLGSNYQLDGIDHLPQSPGADFIIQEALKDVGQPLYIALQGALTDLAIALLKEPKIAPRIIAVWIGGGRYPDGGVEPNLEQDVLAAQVVFNSDITLWQIPLSTYEKSIISFSAVTRNILPYGKIGEYLAHQLFDFSYKFNSMVGKRSGAMLEQWCLGDQPTVAALLNMDRLFYWHEESRPSINDDMTYGDRMQNKKIRIMDWLNVEQILNDLYDKLAICYPNKSQK